MSNLKRLTAAITLGAFISSQITGCLTIPQVPSSFSGAVDKAKSVIAATGPNYKGVFSPDQARAAKDAEAVFAQLNGGSQAVLGYTTPEYAQRNARFKAAKAAIERNPQSFTREQFIELSDSLTSLLSYVDAIESIDTQPKSAYDTVLQGTPSSYQIDPGERATFAMSGYCLKREVIAPSRGDHLQLLPISDVWPANMAPAYQKLIATHQATKKSPLFSTRQNADLQAAIWAMQAAKDGNLTSQTLSSLSAPQMALLAQAGMTPQTLVGGDNLLASASNMALGMVKNTAMNMVNQRVDDAVGSSSISRYGQQASQGALGQVIQNLPVSASDIMGNSTILQDNNLLAQSLQGWLDAQQDGNRPPIAPPETGYTSLGEDLAARASGTGPLVGTVEVVNLSSRPYQFTPANFVLNARNETQPIGVAEWRQTAANDAARVVKSEKDAGIVSVLMGDLKDLAEKEAFKSLTSADSRALTFAKNAFKSRLVQNIVTGLPVVGNVVSLGMLITGKNLDGEPMDSYDYAGAAIGLLPVAGTLSKALGPGARVLAQELDRAAQFFKNRPQIEYAIDTLGSDTAEYVGDSTPAWMREQYTAIARETVNRFPETARYVAQNSVQL